MAKFNFFLGNIKIETNNINEIREMVEELSTKLKPGEEYSKHISDFIYDVEVTYQKYYGFDEDYFDIVPF